MDILPVTSYTALSNFSRIYDFFTLVRGGHATLCGTLLSTITIPRFFCFRGYYFLPLLLQAFAFAFLILVVPPWRRLVFYFHDAKLRTFFRTSKYLRTFFRAFREKLSFCGNCVHFLRKVRKNNTQKVAQKACDGVDEGEGMPVIYCTRTRIRMHAIIYYIANQPPPPLHLRAVLPLYLHIYTTPPPHLYTHATTAPAYCTHAHTPPHARSREWGGACSLGAFKAFQSRYANRCKILKPLSALCLSF